MMGSVVPSISDVKTGMLWNPNDAIDRANGSGDDTDPESNMKTSELMSIKERVDLKDLSLAIFTKILMEDTLPANFWSDRHDEFLKEFAAQPGSLSQLNFLHGLGCVADEDLVQGCLFTGDVVRGEHTLAPPAERIRGSWEEKLNSVSKLLTCAYRLARPGNILEAYQSCTLQECKLLQKHHSQWSANITHSLKNLSVRDTRSANVIDSELGRDLSYALRFALARCKALFTTCHQWLSLDVGSGTRPSMGG
ncbi:unnamed protein product [Pylaiella littoralis]